MQVVIGAGEVGQAIAEVLAPRYRTYLRDIEPAGPAKADVLHICFPYTPSFVDQVESYRQSYAPELVIVHSTVPVGTCDLIQQSVHSPVRGRHPHLAESVRRFIKFFGGPLAPEAAAIFAACGLETVTYPSARDVEAGKLWELAQYGLAIVIEKAIHEYCELNGLDFDVVYTSFAQTYNTGYVRMGEPQFVRPVLKHMPGPIGGHCVVPGSALLGHPLADLVVQQDAVERAPPRQGFRLANKDFLTEAEQNAAYDRLVAAIEKVAE